jgi:CRP/FNR family transcriptional regulator, nitrogen oxide reductase regulator
MLAVPSYTVERVPHEVAEYCQRIGRPMIADRGDVLLRQGDAAVKAYYVKLGYAKVFSAMGEGQERLLGFVGPREVVGVGAAHNALGQTFLGTAIAASHMELQMWQRDFALMSAAQRLDLQEMLDRQLYRGLQTLTARINTVAAGRVPERLATVLLELARDHGHAYAGTVAIGPRVTREDLASMAGTTLHTASRLLADWEKDDILRSHHGQIRLLNMDRLMELANP